MEIMASKQIQRKRPVSQKATEDRRNPSAPDHPPIHLRLEEHRVAELLDVATEIFIEQGFKGASTNEIARLANCSKTTFYARFPTKEKLFIAVIERRMDAVFGRVETSLSADSSMEQILTHLGSIFLEFTLSEEQLALLRVIAMESSRFPELGQRFYDLGPGRAQRFLSAYFEKQVRSGLLRAGDAVIMAEHLLSLMAGAYARSAVLGLRLNTNPGERRKRIKAAVDVFLQAYSANSH